MGKFSEIIILASGEGILRSYSLLEAFIKIQNNTGNNKENKQEKNSSYINGRLCEAEEGKLKDFIQLIKNINHCHSYKGFFKTSFSLFSGTKTVITPIA
ncbi:MAG: hypothetical protein U5L09_00455 [Bacteroidales bacterium]|nr:hypothetical protein [Bacteroidales bacterium]